MLIRHGRLKLFKLNLKLFFFLVEMGLLRIMQDQLDTKIGPSDKLLKTFIFERERRKSSSTFDVIKKITGVSVHPSTVRRQFQHYGGLESSSVVLNKYIHILLFYANVTDSE